MRLSEVKVPVDVLNEAEIVITTSGRILKIEQGSYDRPVLVVSDRGYVLNNYHSWFDSKFKSVTDQELEEEVKRRGLSW